MAPVPISSGRATLHTSSNAVVLGFLRGMTEVGYFSAAYKIFPPCGRSGTRFTWHAKGNVPHAAGESVAALAVTIRKAMDGG